jgi:hypothetical protein
MRAQGWIKGRANAFQDRFIVSASVSAAYLLLTLCQELPVTSMALVLNLQLHAEPAQLVAYYAAAMVPWSLKPVFGALSDLMPVMLPLAS